MFKEMQQDCKIEVKNKNGSALYTFTAEGESELTIQPGDRLSVFVGQDAGPGWYYAQNQLGENGLVPETYVELDSLPPPSMPPPPRPVTFTGQRSKSSAEGDDDSSDDEDYHSGIKPYSSRPNNHRTHHLPTLVSELSDEWDDDWDDTNGAQSSQLRNGQVGSNNGSVHLGPTNGTTTSSLSNEDGQSERSSTLTFSESAKTSVVRKGFSRSFAKGGGEDYLLGKDSVKISSPEALIQEGSYGAEWQRISQPYTCAISSTKKQSKMKGMKSFIVYNITPSFSNIEVSRRFKHFDWLYKRLQEKFICICIPPIPEKQITGRYDTELIDGRRHQLQWWLNRMVNHPVIFQSKVMIHFLTSCADEKKAWKGGKREAEKDVIQGAKFFYAVQTDDVTVNWPAVNDRTDKLENFYSEFEKSNKQIQDTILLFNRKQSGPISKEYIRLGDSFCQLAEAVALDPDEVSEPLRDAVNHTGKTYKDIGTMFNAQPSMDGEPLLERLGEYSGLLTAHPSLLHLQRGAISTIQESKRACDEEKISPDDMATVRRRANTIARAVTAETNWLASERDRDYRDMMREYLTQQINFYEEITNRLRTTLAQYDNCSAT